ncbi:PREDICTED: phosphatidylinositol glycan anchor biosynthesis class U protein isoform X1 [Brassica oleracea var. oleracea]|uniref:GPI transamidase subunit PIG-U n=1 Tax=Brassica oleracea var. oleracea TaxID=109376 RepID=A0A0D2ZR63_BRAOL|nr:PREDICTED: phosphatidylinositol glycan anchor biosynthesis class U protein isoform X1 [Brassica oleracea var. oleracea]
MTKDDGEMVEEQKKKPCRFWIWALSSVLFRLILISYAGNLNLSSRPEVSTPLTSIRRLAEGYWLKQASMSPYAGSMYHGSPLLLSLLGPLTVQRIKGQPSHLFCSLVFVIADILSAILLRGIGKKLQMAYGLNARLLGRLKSPRDKAGILPCGDIAALVYLWNPFTIVCSVGLSTSPIENLAVILALNGAVTRRVPLAAFGLVMATHLSLYPAILTIPVIFLLGYGLDAPPLKLFLQTRNVESGNRSSTSSASKQAKSKPTAQLPFLWKTVVHFVFWALVWSLCVMVLCRLSLSKHGGLEEMFKRTYGFILSIEDLSPNIGVFWYFFAEVFDFFRNFFLIVFHVNILFMLLPLAIRLKHRPCFLAFIYLAISSLLKSYPSVGDSALYLSLWALFVNELADMKFSFFLFCGYLGVSLLSPVMHNLWIWRGTGNANFYFGNAIGYACFQIVFVVESVSAMLNHDRALKKCNPNHQKVKN